MSETPADPRKCVELEIPAVTDQSYRDLAVEIAKSDLMSCGISRVAEIVKRLNASLRDARSDLRGASLGLVVLMLHLRQLDGDGVLCMGDAAKYMGHSTACLTGTIDRAERCGVVARVGGLPKSNGSGGIDRRKIGVTLTPAGRQLIDAAFGPQDQS